MLLFAAVSVEAQVETQRGAAFQYAEQWKAIDRLMEGILPQSALPKIEKVRQAGEARKTTANRRFELSNIF